MTVTENRDALLVELVRLADESGATDEGDASVTLPTWRQRFNALDDGRAAERVVARILDCRMLDSS